MIRIRLATIANLLAEWNLISLVEPAKSKELVVPVSYLKILPFGEKKDWQLVPKYNIGKKRTSDTLD